MASAKLADSLRQITPEALLGLYTNSFGGMLDNPDVFGDGYVLPAHKTAVEIFSDTSTYNSVPIIFGTNRDEVKLFMAFSSDAVSKTFGLPSGIDDLEKYNRDNRYATDSWKIRAVDELASAMKTAGSSGVFAYRFDVDDLRNLGFIRFKDLFGAAHAMEIPFVFGNFPNPMRVIFPDSMRDEFEQLSVQMQSYWAQFAYSGRPGKGRSGGLTEWKEWDNSSDATARLMVFDTQSDRGVRMVYARLTDNDLRSRFLADKSFDTQKEYCAAYKRLFTGQRFDIVEYEGLGKSGCPVVNR